MVEYYTPAHIAMTLTVYGRDNKNKRTIQR